MEHDHETIAPDWTALGEPPRERGTAAPSSSYWDHATGHDVTTKGGVPSELPTPLQRSRVSASPTTRPSLAWIEFQREVPACSCPPERAGPGVTPIRSPQARAFVIVGAIGGIIAAFGGTLALLFFAAMAAVFAGGTHARASHLRCSGCGAPQRVTTDADAATLRNFRWLARGCGALGVIAIVLLIRHVLH